MRGKVWPGNPAPFHAASPIGQRNQPWIGIARPEQSHKPPRRLALGSALGNHAKMCAGVRNSRCGCFSWVVRLVAIAFLAQPAFGYDIAHLPASFAALPMPQRIATGTVGAIALALIGATTWRLLRQDRSLNAARPPQEDSRGRRRRPRPAKPSRRHRPAPDRERPPRGRLCPSRQAGRGRAARPAPAGPQPVRRHARSARRNPPPPTGVA